jgi:hypothetical protein
MRLALGTLIGLFFFLCSASCQEPAVREITIESGGSGLGPSASQKLVILSRGEKNYLGDEVVDSGRIQSLIAALRSPTIASPQASNLGISHEWLSQDVREAPSNGAPNQQALFKESFSDLNTIEQLLPSCFKFWKSDDYPSIRVKVVFANGKRWTASSDSYYPLMLPWRVNLNGTEQTTSLVSGYKSNRISWLGLSSNSDWESNASNTSKMGTFSRLVILKICRIW